MGEGRGSDRTAIGIGQCVFRRRAASHTSRAIKTDAPPRRLIAPGADNRPIGPAGYDDPSRRDDPNAAARCQTPADLTGAAGAGRAGPGIPAGAKGLLLQPSS
eukprot:scaffold14521_cov121-Isochrysis_galbana.AAC.4